MIYILTIKKKFNNNVVLTEDELGNEMVLMGRGLAFSARPNESIDMTNVEKVFRMDQVSSPVQFGQYISNLSEEQMLVTESIITYAKSKIDSELSDYLYLGLTDHIDFVLERIKQGVIIRNPLIWEIKKAYPKEYDVGLHAVKLISNKYGVEIPQDEAGSIALHIVNAQKTVGSLNNLVKELDIIQDIIRIVRYHFSIDMNEDSITFERFFVHTKFFVYRVKNNSQLYEETNMFYTKAVKEWPDSFDCMSKIVQYIEKAEQTHVSEDEKFYLMVHIHRLTKK